jgi:hypothetical protein
LLWLHGGGRLKLQRGTHVSTGLLLALVCGTFVAYLNGANDVSKGIATLAGSGVTNYRRAILWGSLCTGAGCLASSIASKAMIGTFGAGLLREGVQPTLDGALAVLLGGGRMCGDRDTSRSSCFNNSRDRWVRCWRVLLYSRVCGSQLGNPRGKGCSPLVGEPISRSAAGLGDPCYQAPGRQTSRGSP